MADNEKLSPVGDMKDLRKALFRSPAVEQRSDATDTLLNKLQIEHGVEVSVKELQKELHEQRVKQLKQLIKDASDDDWRYPSLNKLIGLE